MKKSPSSTPQSQSSLLASFQTSGQTSGQTSKQASDPATEQLSSPTHFEALKSIIESRRSIRLFEKTPVPESVIQSSLDLALLAPNSSNLQPWEFHWVRTPEVKEKLVKACLSQAAAATAAELVVAVARTKTWRRAQMDMLEQMQEHEKKGTRIPKAAWRYYRKLVPLAYPQGLFSLLGYLKKLLFTGVGFFRPISRQPTSHHQMQLWAVKSTALACENFMLAIRAHDFDTCPMEGIDSTRIRRLLKLPSDALVMMVIAVGKRRPSGVTLPRIRGKREWFIKTV